MREIVGLNEGEMIEI